MSLRDDVAYAMQERGLYEVHYDAHTPAPPRQVSDKENSAGWRTRGCPFHNGSDSFRCNNLNGGWKCFGCNEGGDIFDFEMKRLGCDFKTALHSLATTYDIGQQTPRPTPPTPEQQERVLASYTPPAQELSFAEKHGNKNKAWQDLLGASPDKLDMLVAARDGTIPLELFVMAGVGLAYEYNEERWSLPVYHGEELIGLKLYSNLLDPKMRSVSGSKPGLFPKVEPHSSGECIITEGEWDALTMRHLTPVPAYSGTGGANTWKSEWGGELRDAGYSRITVIYDADEPGRENAPKVAASLGTWGIRTRILDIGRLCTDGEKDITDLLKAGKGDLLFALIEAEPWPETPVEPPPPEEPPEEPDEPDEPFVPMDDIERMNLDYIPIRMGEETRFIDRHHPNVYTLDEGAILSATSFRLTTANIRRTTDSGSVPVCEIWLQAEKRNPTITKIVCDPRLPSGYLPAQGIFNQWCGFQVEPDEAGSYQGFTDHIRQNLCGDNDELVSYLFDWFAACIQQPWRPTGTAIALRGAQGVGKTIATVPLRMIFGEGKHFFHISSREAFLGRFRPEQQRMIVGLIDEAFWSGDKAAEGELKRMITEPTLMIERKFGGRREVPNISHLVFTSNEEWVIPAAFDDRRFFVLDVNGRRRGDTAYFATLIRELRDGGAARFLWDMQHRPLNPVLWHTQPPQTEAHTQQAVEGLDGPAAWWYNALRTGRLIDAQGAVVAGWGDQIIELPTEVLYHQYTEASHEAGHRFPRSHQSFIQRLIRLLPGGRGYYNVSDRFATNRCLRIPPLDECRTAFSLAKHADIDWSAEVAGEQSNLPF